MNDTKKCTSPNGPGRKISETVDGYTKNYTYDAASNITGFTLVKDGTAENTVSYTYDVLNRLTNITDGDIITSYGYDAIGNVTSKTSGTFSTSYSYDNDGNLTGLSNSYNSTPYESYAYAYKYDGNRYSEVGNGITKAYTYDKIGQLTNETITQNDVTTSYDYAYDNRGNRISMLTGEVQTNYEYDNNNRLLAYYDDATGIGMRYSYDNNGNQTLEAEWEKSEDEEYNPGFDLPEFADFRSYTYDELNRLVQTYTYTPDGNELSTYEIGADGYRKSKTVSGLTTGYVWSNGNMVAETNNDGITSLYSYGVTGIETAKTGNDVKYYSKNGHGDVTGVYAPDGTAVSNYLYDAFGNQLTENVDDTNPFRYCGEYFDGETENIYLRNRYYDPSNGRFITEDPIRDGLNWYAYCANNPVMFVDLNGFEESRDRVVLTEDDYEKIQMLTAIYNYAVYNLNDLSVADEAHRLCSVIRQQTKYKGYEGYGPVEFDYTPGIMSLSNIRGYIDNYSYSFELSSVFISISEPYTDSRAEHESGRVLTELSDSDAVGQSFGDLAGSIIDLFAKFEENFNPLYDKLYAGHRCVTVYKYYNSDKNNKKWVKAFYFGDDREVCYYVKNLS